METEILEMIKTESSKEEGYRLMIKEYSQRLYSVVIRMVGDHETTNDVLQNTYMNVFRNIGAFRGASSLYTWLYRIAVNEALTSIRKRKRHPKTIEVSMAHGIAGSQDVDFEEGRRVLMEAVDQLPERQKIAFCLRYFEDMTYEEMAEKENMSQGGLKANFHLAVKKIKKYFSDKGLIDE